MDGVAIFVLILGTNDRKARTFLDGDRGGIYSDDFIHMWSPYIEQSSPGRIIYIRGISCGVWGAKGDV